MSPAGACDGDAGGCDHGQRCGGRRSWGRRFGPGRSFGRAGGAATSPTAWVAAPSGSTSTLALHALFNGVVVGLSSTSIGYAQGLRRRGRSMVPPLTRDLSSSAPDSRSWFVSHAQTTCFDAYGEGSTYNLWHGFALRFEPSARAREHLSHRARSLRAMHRLQRVDSRRTLACPRPDHIQSMPLISRCARPPGPCTRQLHPKS